MAFAQPPVFDPSLYRSSTPGPVEVTGIAFEQVAQLIQPVGRKNDKVRLLGTQAKIESFQAATANQPIIMSLSRANYRFTLLIWANQTLVEVRVVGNNELRGYMWLRTAEELQEVLQTILQDTTPGQTVGELAGVGLTKASWDVPPPRQHHWSQGFGYSSRGYGHYAELDY